MQSTLKRIASLKRPWIALVLFMVGSRSALHLFREVVRQIREPKEWDFLCFWVWGRMGALGLDFYDPVVGKLFMAGRSNSFVKEVLSVGFWYPPQSMLFFASFGGFDVRTASIAWFVTTCLCSLLSSYLAWKLIGGRDWLSLLAIATWLATCTGTVVTIQNAQLHFFLLPLVLATLLDRNKPRAGVWAALGLIFKPIAIALVLILCVSKNYRALMMAALTGLGIILLTGARFGFHHFVTYLVDNPSKRIPFDLYYAYRCNQSLYAVLVRATSHANVSRATAAFLCVVIGAALSAIGLKATLKVNRADPTLAAGIILALALILYPGTLSHYSVLAVPIVLALWSSTSTGPALVAGVAMSLTPEFQTLYLHLGLFVLSVAVALKFGSPKSRERTRETEFAVYAEERHR
jgi:hypothetical protein